MFFVNALSRLIDLYAVLIVFWAVSSWFPNLRGHKVVQLIGRVCEPPLRFTRKHIPLRVAEIDVSPVIVVVALQILSSIIKWTPYPHP
jgi:YggT family protein